MAKVNEEKFRVPWTFIGFWTGVVLAFVGSMIGLIASTNGIHEGRYNAERRAQIQDACIAGNENACRIYEVDYGRGGE